MSYPTRADLFKKWSEAMLRGATVDKPTYSQKSSYGTRRKRPGRFRKRKRKKKMKGD